MVIFTDEHAIRSVEAEIRHNNRMINSLREELAYNQAGNLCLNRLNTKLQQTLRLAERLHDDDAAHSAQGSISTNARVLTSLVDELTDTLNTRESRHERHTADLEYREQTVKPELAQRLAQAQTQCAAPIEVDEATLKTNLLRHEHITAVETDTCSYHFRLRLTFSGLTLTPTFDAPQTADDFKSCWDGTPIPLGEIKIQITKRLDDRGSFILTDAGADKRYDAFSGAMCHPHWIQHDDPCLGDFGPTIAEALNEADFETAVCCLTEFLKQASDSDAAGRWWPLWTDNINADDLRAEYFPCDDCHYTPCRCDDYCDTCGYYECRCCIECGHYPCVCDEEDGDEGEDKDQTERITVGALDTLRQADVVRQTRFELDSNWRTMP